MAAIQHETAQALLPMIISAAITDTPFTYGEAALRLGRSKDNSRMVAQVCDLLDAAAAYAGVPLLALLTVREASGQINRNAWTKNDWGRREEIIARSSQHKFNRDDFQAISKALGDLTGKSNIAAWKFVRTNISDEELYRRIAGSHVPETSDAIDDLGSDIPSQKSSFGVSYARDPKIRTAVKLRASGICEFCRKQGFLDSGGAPYLECHHIIALANEGADRMTNVIALCANDHREAHFGRRRSEMEKEMIRIVREKVAKK